MNTDHTRAADALDQWWDAYQNGEITDGIPTNDMHLIQEITAMHAHAISTTDEQRIWRQTVAQIKQRQQRSGGPLDRLLRITIPWPESHWFPAKLQAAAVVALVIVASLLINLRSGDDRHNPAIFAPGNATPIATPAPQGTPVSGVPMYRGNSARTGEMFGPGPASQPTQIWKFSAIVGVSAPSVEMNNILYLGLDNGSARALDATTGDELWRFNTGKLGRIPFATNGTMVFLTDSESELIALDASTGKEIWRHIGSRGGTTPALHDGNILVDGMNGKSFVLDQKTGAEISRFDFPGELTRSPAYADGVAYGAVKSGTIYAVDVTTGSERWHVDTGSPEVSTPAIAGGLMFASLWAGDNTGSLAAYDVTTGKQVWTYASPNEMGFSATSIANGLVVAGGFDGSVYALNAKDGTLAWSIKTGSNLPITSAPGIAQGIVYVGNADGTILALDQSTGATQWTAQFSGAAAFGPIVDNGMLWLTTALGEVYAFGVGGPAPATPGAVASPVTSAQQSPPSSGVPMLRSDAGRTGAIPDYGPPSQPGQLWIFPDGGTVNALPAIADGVIYAGTADGVEHALDLITGKEIWSFDTGVPGHVVPTVGTDYIFTTTEDGQVIAQEKATGAEVWRHGDIRGFTSPALVGSDIYVDGQGGGGYLLDQKTGAEVAHFTSPLDLTHSASVDNGVTYGPTSDGTMHAIEIDSGTELWKSELTENNLSSPAISDGMLFVAETNDGGFGALTALDQATGAQKWRFETDKRLALTQPAVFNDIVYAGSRDGSVYALNATDGSLKWKTETPTHYLISAAPSIADGVLYAGAGDGQVYAIDATTGDIRWQVAIDGGTGFGPIVAGGTLCVVTQTGKVILFGSATGATPEPSPQ